jgi:hypothetical protein
VDEQVLEGDRAQVEAGVAGLAAVRLVEPAVDHGRLGPAELALAEHGVAGHEPVDRLGRAGDVRAPGPQHLGLVLEHQPAVVDDHDLLEQRAQLVDQVGWRRRSSAGGP